MGGPQYARVYPAHYRQAQERNFIYIYMKQKIKPKKFARGTTCPTTKKISRLDDTAVSTQIGNIN